jgi:hypothetical protein
VGGLAVGLALAFVGWALLANHRGAQDRLLAADIRRRDVFGRGIALTEPSRARVRGVGGVALVLGFALLVAGFLTL